MQEFSTKGAIVDPMFYDVDATELLMLYGIFERAHGRTRQAQAQRLIPDSDGDAMASLLNEVVTVTYSSLMRRLRSISQADAYVFGVPGRLEWEKKSAERPI